MRSFEQAISSSLQRLWVPHGLNDHYWVAGRVGYEELLLPVACLRSSGFRCKLGAFAAGSGVPSLQLGSAHLRNRPEHECADFASALARTTNELWHPVKDRSCLLSVGA